jgi:uncharacterized Zn-binding protein involved in type VI secretion
MALNRVAKLGDICGGSINSTPITKTLTSGILTAVVGSGIASHGQDSHSNAVITGGASRTLVNGIPIARITSPASCGDTVSTGSARTLVNS